MPTYGDNKKRDMARSILPSTKKGGQKDRRRIHKRARTHERALMGDCESEESDFCSVEKSRNLETRNFREERRFKDKVGPFSRWAERSTLSIPQENRLSYLKSIVPDSLIGEHAVSHVEWKDHFENPVVREVREARYSNNSKHYNKTGEREQLARFIQELLQEPEGHALINARLKKSHKTARKHYADGTTKKVGALNARTLKGIHDVDAFLGDLFKALVTSTEFSREDLEPLYHSRVLFGKDAGAFRAPTGIGHPEWLEALRSLYSEKKVSRKAS